MAKRKKKKRKQWLYLLIIVVAIVASYIGYQLYQIYLYYKTDFVRYDGFNIDVPLGYSVHGIDISRHQGNIAWNAVKAMQVKDIKLDFAYIKATEGLTKTDVYYKRNWMKCRELYIPHGAYHFYLANKSGAAQAIHFIKTVKLLPGDLPPVVDIEQLYGAKPDVMRTELKLYLNMIEIQYGVKPIIYTYVNFYENYLGKDFDTYPLWIAHYVQRKQPRIKRDWLFWQFNEHGTVNGISSLTDFNVFNGDSITFNHLLVK